MTGIIRELKCIIGTGPLPSFGKEACLRMGSPCGSRESNAHDVASWLLLPPERFSGGFVAHEFQFLLAAGLGSSPEDGSSGLSFFIYFFDIDFG